MPRGAPKLVHPAAPAPEGAEEAWALLLAGFPLYRGSPPRPLYFKKLTEVQRGDLRAKGYEAISVFELPRGPIQDEVNYLLAKAQGIEEGTIFATDDEIEMLELEMRANKMLGTTSVVVRVPPNLRKKAAREILDSWGNSRHTLRGNSTVIGANNALPVHVSPIEGVRRGGKVSKKAQKEGKGK